MVEVPITVIIPPRIVANERGIRNFDAGFPVRRAQSFTYGIMNATIGVLFNTEDNEDTVNIIRNKNARGDKLGLNNRANASDPNIVRMPAVTSTNKKMMMIC